MSQTRLDTLEVNRTYFEVEAPGQRPDLPFIAPIPINRMAYVVKAAIDTHQDDSTPEQYPALQHLKRLHSNMFDFVRGNRAHNPYISPNRAEIVHPFLADRREPIISSMLEMSPRENETFESAHSVFMPVEAFFKQVVEEQVTVVFFPPKLKQLG